jgi:hypothetical protein
MGIEFAKLETNGISWIVKPMLCESCAAKGFSATIVLGDGLELPISSFVNRQDAIAFINSVKKAGIKSE